MSDSSGPGCALCGSRTSKHQFELDGDHIVRCDCCGLVYSKYQGPGSRRAIPAYNANYFHSNHYRGGYQDYDADFISHQQAFERRLIEAERRLGTVGSLLDVGCAFGYLGQVAQHRGWKTFGTDISVYAASRAYHERGQRVYVSDVSRHCVSAGLFDLICMYDVIEHMPQPVAALRQLRPILKPGGMIHISTPDVESLSARILGRYWYHYKAYEHICYFSYETLHMALTRAGFKVVDIGPLPSYMTVQDILLRLRFYSRLGAGTLLYLSGFLKLHQTIVKINVGELGAWAIAE